MLSNSYNDQHQQQQQQSVVAQAAINQFTGANALAAAAALNNGTFNAYPNQNLAAYQGNL